MIGIVPRPRPCAFKGQSCFWGLSGFAITAALFEGFAQLPRFLSSQRASRLATYGPGYYLLDSDRRIGQYVFRPTSAAESRRVDKRRPMQRDPIFPNSAIRHLSW